MSDTVTRSQIWSFILPLKVYLAGLGTKLQVIESSAPFPTLDRQLALWFARCRSISFLFLFFFFAFSVPPSLIPRSKASRSWCRRSWPSPPSEARTVASDEMTLQEDGKLPPVAPVVMTRADDGARRRRKLPAFLDHFSARDLKVLFRCWVAAWVASIFMFITPILTNIGPATFFAR